MQLFIEIISRSSSLLRFQTWAVLGSGKLDGEAELPVLHGGLLYLLQVCI